MFKLFLKEDTTGGPSADILLAHIPRVSCRPQKELLGHPLVFIHLISTLGKAMVGSGHLGNVH